MTPLNRLCLRATLASAFLFILIPLRAVVVPNGIFSDHLVLQRDKPITLWGKADPGELVTVELGNIKNSVATRSDGSWELILPPRSASSQPEILTISGDKTPTPVIIRDVLIGDVWLCSGQSNMTFFMKYLSNNPTYSHDLAEADYPLIRQGKVPREPSLSLIESKKINWITCNPQSVGDFTAVGFYFARHIQKETGVPIGLILASFGSTSIEQWISKDSLDTIPEFKNRADRQMEALKNYESKPEYLKSCWKWMDRFKGPFTIPNINKTATVFFNGMIRPVAPYPMKGVLWYQGEEDALARRGQEYQRLLPLLINDWRTVFGQPELPFIIQQLPEFKGEGASKTEWAGFRESQKLALKNMSHASLVIGLGCGEPDNIHPADKREIGRRMALVALRETYGKEVCASGPTFDSMTLEESGIRLRFRNAHGLCTTDGKAPMGFLISGKNGLFVPAKARVDAETVLISTEGVSRPFTIRYSFQNVPINHLMNDAGLPAAPFTAELR